MQRSGLAEGYTVLHCTILLDLTSRSEFTTVGTHRLVHSNANFNLENYYSLMVFKIII